MEMDIIFIQRKVMDLDGVDARIILNPLQIILNNI